MPAYRSAPSRRWRARASASPTRTSLRSDRERRIAGACGHDIDHPGASVGLEKPRQKLRHRTDFVRSAWNGTLMNADRCLRRHQCRAMHPQQSVHGVILRADELYPGEASRKDGAYVLLGGLPLRVRRSLIAAGRQLLSSHQLQVSPVERRERLAVDRNHRTAALEPIRRQVATTPLRLHLSMQTPQNVTGKQAAKGSAVVLSTIRSSRSPGSSRAFARNCSDRDSSNASVFAPLHSPYEISPKTPAVEKTTLLACLVSVTEENRASRTQRAMPL